MREILNGYQCEKCNTIYHIKEQALKCEKTVFETPLLKIGDILIDDSYGTATEVTVGEIYFEKHEAVYTFYWRGFDGNEDLKRLYRISGNEMLNDCFELDKETE